MASRRSMDEEPLWYLKSVPYGTYLQSRHWKAFREEFFEWFKASHSHSLRCERCGIETIDGHTEPQWNVHHKTYERLGEEEFGDVELLCLMCHNLEHYPESHAAKYWVKHLQGRSYLHHLVERLERGE